MIIKNSVSVKLTKENTRMLYRKKKMEIPDITLDSLRKNDDPCKENVTLK